MAGKNQRKVTLLIGTAMGLVMGIYWKTLQAIRKDLVPETDKARGKAEAKENEDEAQKLE